MEINPNLCKIVYSLQRFLQSFKVLFETESSVRPNFLLAARFWLILACCLLLSTDCQLPSVQCSLLSPGCFLGFFFAFQLFSVCCCLLFTCYLLFSRKYNHKNGNTLSTLSLFHLYVSPYDFRNTNYFHYIRMAVKMKKESRVILLLERLETFKISV